MTFQKLSSREEVVAELKAIMTNWLNIGGKDQLEEDLQRTHGGDPEGLSLMFPSPPFYAMQFCLVALVSGLWVQPSFY